MPEILSPILPDKFSPIFAGVGMNTVRFCVSIEGIEYGYGGLYKYKIPVGYLAISPDRVLMGSNRAISKITHVGGLCVWEFDREKFINRLLESPTKKLAEVVHIIKNYPTFPQEYSTLRDLNLAMITIVSGWN